jgi:hypothetical protein
MMRKQRARRSLILAAATFVAMVVAGCASTATAPRNNYVDRFTRAMVTLLPMGELFDRFIAKDPEWPVKGKMDKVTPEQLACLRRELSSDGYTHTRRLEVEAYVKAHPSQLKDEIELLESGAAEAYGKMIKAGFDAKLSGASADSNSILKSMQSEQLLSFMKFSTDINYSDLRKLAGIGEALADVDDTKKSQHNAGQRVGKSLASKYIFQATATCKVPPAAYM